MQLKLRGLSSKTTQRLEVRPADLGKTVLDFLRENDIPIASSCRGIGICQKCIINKDLLSCEWNIENFLNKKGNLITVSYL